MRALRPAARKIIAFRKSFAVSIRRCPHTVETGGPGGTGAKQYCPEENGD